MRITQEQNARKERLDERAAWALATQADEVRVAKGKKVLRFESSPENKAGILAAVMGPTGNLRAPALLAGGILWVGYNAELYEELRSAMRG